MASAIGTVWNPLSDGVGSMPKRPRKPNREDFNEAALRVVREATEGHDPDPRPTAIPVRNRKKQSPPPSFPSR